MSRRSAGPRTPAPNLTERAPAQRRVDALIELIAKGSTVGAAMPAPLVHIVLGEDVITDAFGRLDPGGPVCGHDDEPCTRHTGGTHGYARQPENGDEPPGGEPVADHDQGDIETGDTGDADDVDLAGFTDDLPDEADPEPEIPGTAKTGDTASRADQPDPEPDEPEEPGPQPSGDAPDEPPPEPPGRDGPPLQPAPWLPVELLAMDPHIPRRRSELADGTPLHPVFGIAGLAVAELRRIVLSADGEILDLGKSKRNFPQRLRQAIIARDRGRCATPGCGAPMAWLQADHYWPWSREGPGTNTTNSQLLCGHCNKIKGNRPPANNTKPDWPNAA